MLENDELIMLGLHGARIGMWELDPATMQNRWHESMGAVMGVDPARVVTEGANFLEYMHPDDRGHVIEKFDEALRTRREGVVWQADFRITRPDGQLRWINSRGTYVKREGHLMLMGIAQDITDRKRDEERLRESESRFRLIADSVPVLIWMVDRDRVAFLNRAYYEFVGLSPDVPPASVEWTNYVHPDDRDRYVQAWKSMAHHGERFEDEMRLLRHDGEYRWMHSVGIPRFNADGGLEGYSGATFDVHGARVAMQVLSDADRRKDQFLATLAHELRNPLAPLKNGLHLLSRQGVGDAGQPVLEMMTRQIGVMSRLLDDLLDVGRISRGRLELQRKFVTLGDVVRLAVESSRAQIESLGHTLGVSLSDETLKMDVDPVRIAQVITNLLNNAAKYTPAGGRIDLSAGLEGREVVIVVEDNGRGIMPEDIPDVFELFVRSSGREGGGLGIGLSLARTLVEMHGGSIRAYSDGPGQGSRFEVRLPA